MAPTEDHQHEDESSSQPGGLVDRITDPLFAVDEDLRVTDANDAAMSLFREASSRTLDETNFVGSPIAEYGWLAGTNLADQLEMATAADDSSSFEVYYEPTGSWLTGRYYPSATGLSVLVQEDRTTEQRRSELSDRMSVIRESYEAMADRSESFEQRVTKLLEIGSAELDLDYGLLSNVRGGEEYVFEIIWPQEMPVEPGHSIPLEEVYCERTVRDRETLVLADVPEEAPELTDRIGYMMLGIESYVSTPVVVDGEIYGTFCLGDIDAQQRSFSDWEILIVELMGELISYTLERRQTEQRLEHQNERLEQFASVLSHDLQTPLTTARGTLELLDADEQEHVERIEHAHERMSEIIDDSIEMARQGNPVETVTRVDLSTVGERAWETVETAAATLEVESATIYADESRCYRLLENLYRNAIQHAGTDVTVSVGPLESKTGFYVADDGPGIPAADREQVLEFGYSSEDDGTGFGLTIVKQIAEAHGWSVRVTESDTGGARFEFVDSNVNA